MSDRVDIIFNNSRLICAIEICTFFSTKGGHNAKEFFGNNTSKRSQNNMTHVYFSDIPDLSEECNFKYFDSWGIYN